uniref:Uncharacterized protein n=1 Tax=Arundo donax TaxID=35708 RepID=A0A0A9BI68_ARUDO
MLAVRPFRTDDIFVLTRAAMLRATTEKLKRITQSKCRNEMWKKIQSKRLK